MRLVGLVAKIMVNVSLRQKLVGEVQQGGLRWYDVFRKACFVPLQNILSKKYLKILYSSMASAEASS